MKSLSPWFSLVRFSHSIFALPFALMGAWLAAGGVPTARTLVLIVVCAVLARTSAMGFNRLVDRAIDAQNPRTKTREIPAGALTPSAVLALVLVSGALFIAASFALNTLAGWLSIPVLAVLTAYSYVKRFSALAHVVLGIALALAPLGAWIAVRGDFEGDLAPVAWLAGAVASWVAGFDLIYACQDAEFDRETGLHSIPARFGVPFALHLSSAMHALTILCLVAVGLSAHVGYIYWIALSGASILLVCEHHIVRPSDLSRVNLAFFTLNGWVGVGLFVGLALDRSLAGS